MTFDPTQVDALKAAAYDMRRLADKHSAALRAVGQDELADQLERMARDAEANAQEHDG
jgi:hypothetical protein